MMSLKVQGVPTSGLEKLGGNSSLSDVGTIIMHMFGIYTCVYTHESKT
jgi:hypothetical protein